MTRTEQAVQATIAVLIPLIGYREKQSNAQLSELIANAGSNNYTLFAAFFDDLWNHGYKFYNTRKNGPAGEWCDMTVDYAVINGAAKGDPELARKILYQPMESCGAGCKFSADYYRSNSAWLSGGQRPKAGYQIFFGPYKQESHTGLVEKSDGVYVYTLEGNVGNQLVRRQYQLDDATISGYGRPRYELAEHLYTEETSNTAEDAQTADDVETPGGLQVCTVTLPVLSRGSTGGHVESMQVLMKHYADNAMVIDGSFGPLTERLVKEYQARHNEVVDGVVGPITWALLLR